MFKLLTPNRWATKAVLMTTGILMGAWALPSVGGQSPTANSSFAVTVKLTPAAATVPPASPVAPVAPVIVPPGLPVSAFCTRDNLPNANGAVVTVVCTTGTVVGASTADNTFSLANGGSYRYVTQVTPNADLNDTSSTFSGAGTTTSWRVVHHSGRDYLEMTLGW